ncbi:hypothetical protein AVEN_112001-1 [Araneus ventricosus]|uniref:Uncharacterized protein n=1 Tax=Araneus ventricosus TaxID=182803 RepID=A0A4Y2I193_ARAVE|nr:hypothetical protein AVEN_112001-1 [Araneus ventricosus]
MDWSMKFQLKSANYTIKHSSVHDCAVTSQKNKVAKIIQYCIGYIFINFGIGPAGNCVRRFVIPAVDFGATCISLTGKFFASQSHQLSDISVLMNF